MEQDDPDDTEMWHPSESQGVTKNRLTVLHHKCSETKRKKNGIRTMSSKVSLPQYLHKSLH